MSFHTPPPKQKRRLTLLRGGRVSHLKHTRVCHKTPRALSFLYYCKLHNQPKFLQIKYKYCTVKVQMTDDYI